MPPKCADRIAIQSAVGAATTAAASSPRRHARAPRSAGGTNTPAASTLVSRTSPAAASTPAPSQRRPSSTARTPAAITSSDGPSVRLRPTLTTIPAPSIVPTQRTRLCRFSGGNHQRAAAQAKSNQQTTFVQA